MTKKIAEVHMIAIKSALEETYLTQQEIAEKFKIAQGWISTFAKTHNIKRPRDYASVRSKISAEKVSSVRSKICFHQVNGVGVPSEDIVAKAFEGCRFEDVALKPCNIRARVYG